MKTTVKLWHHEIDKDNIIIYNILNIYCILGGKQNMPKLNGVHVPHRKNTAEMTPVRMPVPATLYFPMSQHIGAPAKPVVAKGDKVYKGTLIGEAGGFVSSPIYSSTSGTVTAVKDTIQSNGNYVPTVVIESDGEDLPDPAITAPEVTDFDSFIAAVRNSGIVGLGGAGFPTSVKLGVKDLSKVDYIILNGAECEPYLTGDTRTMLDRTEDIAEGIRLLKKYFNAKFLAGIEKNKPKCIAKMKTIDGLTVKALPSIYPQGGEKVLIFNTTGRIVPEGALPLDTGCIVINVTTLAEIARYMRTGMPLVEKCITVDGTAIKDPKNVIAPIGTPVGEVLDFCGGYNLPPEKVLYGGPMMGMSLPALDCPVIKQTNGLTAFSIREAALPEPTNCIRCGRCEHACPLALRPALINQALIDNDMEELQNLHANLCMECGCCSFVCPAYRPIVQQNKLAKGKLAAYLKSKGGNK